MTLRNVSRQNKRCNTSTSEDTRTATKRARRAPRPTCYFLIEIGLVFQYRMLSTFKNLSKGVSRLPVGLNESPVLFYSSFTLVLSASFPLNQYTLQQKSTPSIAVLFYLNLFHLGEVCQKELPPGSGSGVDSWLFNSSSMSRASAVPMIHGRPIQTACVVSRFACLLCHHRYSRRTPADSLDRPRPWKMHTEKGRRRLTLSLYR